MFQFKLWSLDEQLFNFIGLEKSVPLHLTERKMEASDPSTLDWWHKTIIYQIYPRSFQDSNASGVGDLPGVISRLDYFVDIGVETLWLSPFYPSPQADFGYDVSNYCDVDPLFGSLDDFDRLVKEAHDRGLKILVDFVPGHSSDLHPWFQKSLKKEVPYTDFYVWHDGKLDSKGNRVPPNNWLSVFAGTSWYWNEGRQQFYYRPFIPGQPKLNYRCPQLAEEMKNVLRFWFDRGVDGMRLDAINELVEAEDKSLDEPRSSDNCLPDEYEYLDHIHTTLQPETFQEIKKWSALMNDYTKADGHPRFMIAETYCDPDKRNRYRESGVVPSNMDLVLAEDEQLSGQTVRSKVDREYSNLPPGAWPTFLVGNHDRHRVSYRHGPEFVDAFNTLLLTLKGSPTTYYGEEIGMKNIDVTYEQTQDPFGINMGPERYQLFSRDPTRSPMQWNNTPNSGFSTSDKTWLPVHPGYTERNVQDQLDRDGESHLKLYKTLAHLRRAPAFTYGSLKYAFTNEELFSYLREDQSSYSRYLVVINFGQKSCCAGQDLTGHPVNAKRGVVRATGTSVDTAFRVGQPVQLESLDLKPGDCFVVQLDN